MRTRHWVQAAKSPSPSEKAVIGAPASVEDRRSGHRPAEACNRGGLLRPKAPWGKRVVKSVWEEVCTTSPEARNDAVLDTFDW